MVRRALNAEAKEFEKRVRELFKRHERGTIISGVSHRPTPHRTEEICRKDLQLPPRDR